MTWRRLSLMSWALAWIGLIGCSHQVKVDPFVCDVEPAYTKDGLIDPVRYNVNRSCLKGVNLRLQACYREAK